MTKQVLKEDPYFFNIEPPVDYTRLLVISLGTGSDTSEIKFDAKKASKWGLFCWLYEDGTSPLIDVYSQGSSDLVDYLNSVVFKAFQSEKNYLRINVRFSLITVFSLVARVLLKCLLLVPSIGGENRFHVGMLLGD